MNGEHHYRVGPGIRRALRSDMHLVLAGGTHKSSRDGRVAGLVHVAGVERFPGALDDRQIVPAPSSAPDRKGAILGHEVRPGIDELRVHAEDVADGGLGFSRRIVSGTERSRRRVNECRESRNIGLRRESERDPHHRRASARFDTDMSLFDISRDRLSRQAHDKRVLCGLEVLPPGLDFRGWKNARITAEVQCRFHDLQHSAVTLLLEAGVSFPIVASLLGWSPSTTTKMARRYGHIGNAAHRAAVATLDPLSGRAGGTKEGTASAEPEDSEAVSAWFKMVRRT